MFLIYITPQGVEESNRARTIIRKVNEEIKSGFSEKEIQTFKKILHSFSEKFSNKGWAREPARTGLSIMRFGI
jgi:DNA-binding MarR family transcriptional regulator